MGTFVPPPPPRPIEQPNSMEQLGQLMAMRNAIQEQPLRMQALQQQTQMGQMQLQAQQQQMASTQALMAAGQAVDPSDPQYFQKVFQKAQASGKVLPQQLMQYSNAVLDHQTKLAQLPKEQLAAQQALGDSLYSLGTQYLKLPDDQMAQQWPAVRQKIMNLEGMNPQVASQQVPEQFPGREGVQALTTQVGMSAAMMRAASQLQSSRFKVVDGTLYDVSGEKPVPALQGQLNPAQWSAAVDSIVPPDGANSAINARTHAAVNFYLKQGNAEAAQKAITDASQQIGAVEKETNPQVIGAREAVAGYEARMRQALSQGDPNAAAQLLVNGDATLSELKARGSTPDFITKTLAAAHQLSGGQYNPQEAEAQFDIAKSPANTTFFGSAKSLIAKGGTLDQLAAAGKDLPGGKFPAFNSIADWERAATGSGPIAKYAATALGVADDYAKVMGGGQGSDTSRLQALNLIGAKQSPDQRAAAIDGIRNAVNSQAVERIGKNKVMQRMYGEGLQMPGPAGATVRLRAPNGQIKEVPADQMQHYLSLGAKQVQ